MLRRAAEIVSAYVANNSVTAQALPDLLRMVHRSLSDLTVHDVFMKPIEKQKPAVPVSKSVQNDYIICLEDGKHLTMLKRYLRSHYDISPEDYRRKWGLTTDYPMVAPAYARRRSALAKSIGLGKGVRRKPKST
jgi:predicted transcriptional regulator